MAWRTAVAPLLSSLAHVRRAPLALVRRGPLAPAAGARLASGAVSAAASGQPVPFALVPDSPAPRAPEGDALTVRMNGVDIPLSAQWLRVNCRCPECTHSTGQRLVSFASPQARSPLAALTVTDEALTAEFADGHRCEFSAAFLWDHCTADQRCARRAAELQSPPALMGEPPQIALDEIESSKEGVLRWLSMLHQHGVVCVTGAPTETGFVRHLAERIAPISHSAQYGKTFAVKSKVEPDNIAYTEEALDFHQDLVYYESPPGIQFLHCVMFDDAVKGGESALVDAMAAAERLRASDPDAFRVLSTVSATFQKRALNRPNATFLRYRRPHFQLDAGGAIVAVFWAPVFEGPLIAPPEVVPEYARAYAVFARLLEDPAFVVRRRLRPGDVLVFNQRRMLHARTGFSGAGTRHLEGTYVNIDDFTSRLRVLAYQVHGDVGSDLAAVGNSSSVSS